MITKVESNEDYHSNKRYLSSSAVKTIVSRSVYHLLNSKPYTETEAMKEGTAVHARMLEPDLYHDTYVVMEPFNGRTKEGKAIKASYESLESEGKILLKAEQSDMIEALYENLQENELAKKYCIGDIELSHYSEFMDVKCKVRPDVKGVDFISDIKTCQDASPRAFKSEIYKRNYHVQAAFYCTVLDYPLGAFKFIAMQKTYPYDVIVYSLSEDLMEEGYKRMVKAVDEWRTYLDKGIVTGYDGLRSEDGSIIL